MVLTQSCVNQDNNYVDWWVSLKPSTSLYPGFFYLDSQIVKSSQSQFIIKSKSIDTQGTSLYQTLKQNNYLEELQTLAWNDEKPDGQYTTIKGHSKGLLSYDIKSKKGFYLSHSLPKYPAFTEQMKVNITINYSQLVYGQNLLCISMNLTQLNNLAQVIRYSTIYTYHNSIIQSQQTNYIYQMGQSHYYNKSNLFYDISFQVGEFNIYAISKNNQINGSIYQDGLSVKLSTPLITQSWGRPLQIDYCQYPNWVANVQIVKIGNIQWKESQDHSKWSVSPIKDILCMGDMNRMISQFKRGGNYYCIYNKNLAIAFRNAIEKYTKCPDNYQ